MWCGVSGALNVHLALTGEAWQPLEQVSLPLSWGQACAHHYSCMEPGLSTVPLLVPATLRPAKGPCLPHLRSPHHQATSSPGQEFPHSHISHFFWVPSQSWLNQSILKESSPNYSLEELILKLKLQYFGHLMRRTDSLQKTLILGKIEGRRRRGWQRLRWLDGITDDEHEFEHALGVGDGQGGLVCCSPWGHKELNSTERLNWLNWPLPRHRSHTDYWYSFFPSY